ncbi:S8 family peptidase [Luedemannella flava]
MVLAAALVLPLTLETGAVSASPGVSTAGPTSSAVAFPEGGRGRIGPLPMHRQAIPGEYVAVFRDDVSAQSVDAVIQALRALYRQIIIQRIYYAAVRGFLFRGTPHLARAVGQDERIQYVQPNYRVLAQGSVVAGTQNNPPWGLDRIDQRDLPLNHRYVYPNTGSGVNAYVVDSGIRTSHREFGGRATIGADFTGSGNTDCNGHGTHVAGTIGGANVGVAKAVRLYALKVLGCNGQGSTAGILSALDWVVKNGRRPGVVNMSLGHAGTDPALSKAILGVLAVGITVVVAAGNNAGDACAVSPARTIIVITVGATNNKDSRDTRYSNYGRCVNIFAPGTDIYSAWNASNSAYQTMSGTSMASPHTAGVVALILQAHTNYSPLQVADCMTAMATYNTLTNIGNGSPNRMLHTGQICS